MMLLKAFPFVLLLRNVWSITLNIHLPLRKVNNTWSFDQCPYNAAIEANLALRQSSSSETINFFQKHSPHVTLFLSDFDVEGMNETDLLEEISGIVQHVVSNQSQSMCVVVWPADPKAVQVYGSYAMYPIPKSSCLQALSDDLVRALNPYILRPPVVPDWIYNLPLIPRWRKLWLLKKYGSPNVFGEYDPHVTVGYNTDASVESRLNALQSIPARGLECKGTLASVAIGRVGEGGSVLQEGIVKTIILNNEEPSIPK